MYVLLNLFIFCLVFFIYIHVYFHIKTSNYLEIYEIENPSKDKLEELCDLKQPLLLKNINILTTNTISLNDLNTNYGSFDVKIRNKEQQDIYLPLNLSTALDLFSKDNSSNYISENNKDFLDETSSGKTISKHDLFLRPYSVSNIDYDILFGSLNSVTPFRYNINCRNYFFIDDGEIEIVLASPKNYKYLYVDKDYEHLEFKSKIDIRAPLDQYKKDFDKVKLLKVNLKKNDIIQIPAYWFYSIKLLTPNTLIYNLKYRTYMNNVAILPDLFIKFLQNQNIKKNIAKIIK